MCRNGSHAALAFYVVAHIHFGPVAAAFCIAVMIYYLAWKYIVNFFNGVAGIE